jgi:hypothetical protein
VSDDDNDDNEKETEKEKEDRFNVLDSPLELDEFARVNTERKIKVKW